MSAENHIPDADAGSEWARHKVVIIAAVAAVVGNAEIKKIRPLPNANPWTRQGRMTIQGSHDVSRQRAGRTVPERRG